MQVKASGSKSVWFYKNETRASNRKQATHEKLPKKTFANESHL
jgi:hypothetical protein